MNDYIKKLRIYDENNQPQDLQIDYNALANLPEALPAIGGNAETAYCDGNGNNIAETYATKEILSSAISATRGELLSTIYNLYSYGTEDLIPGSSELPTGKLYFVYE